MKSEQKENTHLNSVWFVVGDVHRFRITRVCVKIDRNNILNKKKKSEDERGFGDAHRQPHLNENTQLRQTQTID